MKRLTKIVPYFFILAVFFVTNNSYAAGDKILELSASTRFDDNVFRSDERAAGLLGKKISDSVVTLDAKLGYAFEYSKQKVLFNVGLSDTRYQTRNELNNKPVNVGVSWGLNASGKLNTGVNLNYSTKSSEFSDTQIKKQNTVTRKNFKYVLNYSPDSKLALGFSAGLSETANSLALLETQDRFNQDLNVNGNYQINSKVSCSVSYSVLVSEPRVGNDNTLSFNQQSRSAGLNWVYSPKTSIKVSLGNSSTRIKDSLNYNLSLSYQASPKSSLGFLAFQSIAESTSDISLLTESQGGEFTYSWQMTPKLSSGLSLRRVKQVSDTTFANTTVSEVESINTSYLFSLSYLFSKNLAINSSISHQARESENLLSDYEANIFQINFNLKL